MQEEMRRPPRTPHGVRASPFDVGAVPPARWLSGIGALVLLVSLFMEWYSGNGYPQNGWDAFDGDKLVGLFAVVAIAAIGLDLLEIDLGLPVTTGQLLALCGGLSLFVVVLRLIDLSHRGNGLYLAFLAALALTAGGVLEARGSTPAAPRRVR
jgi:hypothetical protein